MKNGETLFADLMGLSFDIRRFIKISDCPCCVKKEFKKKSSLQITLPKNLDEYVILDVRSLSESQDCAFIQKIRHTGNVIQVPLEKVPEFKPLAGQKYLTICSRGIRSLNACNQLNKNNVDAYSLIGGVEALTWRNQYE